MIQQLLLWANFSAFLLFFCKPTISGRSRSSRKGGVIFDLGMRVSLLSTQSNAIQGFNAIPQWDSHFVAPICFTWSLCLLVLSSCIYLCSRQSEEPGQPGVKPLGYRGRKYIHPHALPENGTASPPPPGLPFARSLIQSCLKAPMPRIGAQAGTGAVPREIDGIYPDFYTFFVQNAICFTRRGRSGSEAMRFSSCCIFKLSQALAQPAFVIHSFPDIPLHSSAETVESKEQIFQTSHPGLVLKQ